ncbi:MAG: serine--tRNA ligase, partial [Bacteroidaceae bacterium]|nr:serine--tRNA ligase [Bacteroidaceae bacterium]
MLTLKLINEQTDKVIAGLNKKHFKGAEEAIKKVQEIDAKRRATQNELDKNLAEVNKLSKSIGAFMKQGQKAEAEAAKAQVASLKEVNKSLEEQMKGAQDELTATLCTIPNIPYDEVPEGSCAEDNQVVKSNLRECQPGDTVGNWTTVP